jgi:hypothetical protein
MNTHDLDTLCGYCAGRGHRDILGGVWLSGPACPDCGGIGYLVVSPDADRLLAFIERHLGRLLRLEIASLRTELAADRSPAALARVVRSTGT